MAIYESGKETAKKIRRDLKACYPDIKFYVTSDYNKVCIHWTDGPMIDQVNYDVLSNYDSGSYTRQDDCRMKGSGYLDKETKEYIQGPEYIFPSRKISDEYQAVIDAEVVRHFGYKDDSWLYHYTEHAHRLDAEKRLLMAAPMLAITNLMEAEIISLAQLGGTIDQKYYDAIDKAFNLGFGVTNGPDWLKADLKREFENVINRLYYSTVYKETDLREETDPIPAVNRLGQIIQNYNDPIYPDLHPVMLPWDHALDYKAGDVCRDDHDTCWLFQTYDANGQPSAIECLESDSLADAIKEAKDLVLTKQASDLFSQSEIEEIKAVLISELTTPSQATTGPVCFRCRRDSCPCQESSKPVQAARKPFDVSSLLSSIGL